MWHANYALELSVEWDGTRQTLIVPRGVV
jgi:hypothetical protein